MPATLPGFVTALDREVKVHDVLASHPSAKKAEGWGTASF
jgi:hypothetical protein